MKLVTAACWLVAAIFAQAAQAGVTWLEDVDEAISKAKAADKLVFLDFYAEWCGPCKLMDRESYPDADVVDLLTMHYIAVRIDVDENEAVADKYNGNAARSGGSGIPAMIVLDAGGEELYRHHGYLSAHELKETLRTVVEKR